MPGAYKTLTAKQEAFVRAYMELGNATEAYGRVYNGNGTMSRATLARNAHELLDQAKVQERLGQLKEEHQQTLNKRAARTSADYVAFLEEAIDIAKQTGNATALVNARMAQAKLEGMLVDKVEQRVGALDPEEAKPDIASLWSRLEQNKGNETQH